MLTWLKYLPQIILMFRNVSTAYSEETGQEKPIYLSRRFVGTCLTAIGILVTVFMGVPIDTTALDVIADSWVTIATSIITLWGVMLGIIGQLKKQPIVVAGVKG